MISAPRRLILPVLIAVVFLSSTSSNHAATLTYFDDTRRFYNFDTVTGISTLRSVEQGDVRFFGLDMRPSDHVVFGIEYDNLDSKLYTVNLDTGAYTLVGPTGVSGLAGLAFHPVTSELYAIRNSGEGAGLFKLNDQTGAATFVGTPGSSFPNVVERGISFSPAGQLFGFNLYGTLFGVNPNTAAVTAIGANTPSLLAEDSTFTADGQLFAADYFGNILQINPLTGAATVVGNTGLGSGLLGIVAVPEPSTLTLLVPGLAWLLLRQQHKGRGRFHLLNSGHASCKKSITW